MSIESLSLPNIGALLRKKKLFLVSAESCSAGLLGHLITSLAGSSDYYLGGLITYSNLSKTAFLKVDQYTLQQYGAVSRQTVLQMANGARQVFSSQKRPKDLVGLATSGIAGPGGGSLQKPVGTVWVAFSSALSEQAREFHFQGTRDEIKWQTALQAMILLQTVLLQP